MFWRDLDKLALDLLAGAGQAAVIIAPFIKRAPLEILLAAVPTGAVLSVYTRWRPEEVAAGVSDTSILELVERLGGTVYLIDELHAKLILVDGTRALVGSANVTAAGLGLARRSNLELMTPLAVDPQTEALLFAELRTRSRQATYEEAAAVERLAEEIRPNLPSFQDPEAQETCDERVEHTWVPVFRSPDRLYGLYDDPEWMLAAKSTDPALRDLIELEVPPGLDQGGFMAHVRARLLVTAAVQALDDALDRKERFGALTALLRDVLPEASHAERQAALQVLIRWLLFFAPERYHMETPGYSELLSLR